jgi:hypothetical protein
MFHNIRKRKIVMDSTKLKSDLNSNFQGKKIPGNRNIYVCHLMNHESHQHILGYVSADPEEFIKNAGKESWKIAHNVEGCAGAYIVVVRHKGGRWRAVSIGIFSVAANGKLYPYMGQGVFQMRAASAKWLVSTTQKRFKDFGEWL